MFVKSVLGAVSPEVDVGFLQRLALVGAGCVHRPAAVSHLDALEALAVVHARLRQEGPGVLLATQSIGVAA